MSRMEQVKTVTRRSLFAFAASSCTSGVASFNAAMHHPSLSYLAPLREFLSEMARFACALCCMASET